jgi:hypothetical protein
MTACNLVMPYLMSYFLIVKIYCHQKIPDPLLTEAMTLFLDAPMAKKVNFALKNKLSK